jgi:dihydrofolate synthase/folylpolyglutamate synthase
VAAFARVEAARQKAGNVALTYFEFGTLAAWEVFAAAGVEAMILEVGLGGRLDAVNAYEPDVSIVTTMALDHTEWLGPDRESIGFEKAGIYRAGKPALCADAQPPQRLLDHAAAIGADLRLIGRDFGFERPRAKAMKTACNGAGGAAPGDGGEAFAGLPGPARADPAVQRGVALAALEALGDKLPVTMQAIRPGTDRNRTGRPLPGRPGQAGDRPRRRPQSAGDRGAR